MQFVSYDIGKVRLLEYFEQRKGHGIGQVYAIQGGHNVTGPFKQFRSPKPGVHPESLLKFAMLNAQHKRLLEKNEGIAFTEEDELLFQDKEELFDSEPNPYSENSEEADQPAEETDL